MSAHTPIEDFATAPGVTLQDSMDALGMSRAELAERAGINEVAVSRIIDGVEPISDAIARKLERILLVPAGFWLKLESNHRESVVGDKEY